MISLKNLENGFEYIEVKNAHAEAKIALQGAHLFHFQAKGKEPLLWLSDKAFFEKGKAIRGGVPICFPWFGKNTEDASLPQHGFARNQMWTLSSWEELEDGSTQVILQLNTNDETRKLWDYEFQLTLELIIGSELSMTLTTTNCDSYPFEITQALHSYFQVSNITNVSVKGLENTIYYNSLDQQLYKQHKAVTIDQEVDSVYFDSSKTIVLKDNEREITLKQEGSKSLVLWNPWIEKSKAMADMPNDGYETMLCLETGNVLKDFRIIGAGGSFSLRVVVSQN